MPMMTFRMMKPTMKAWTAGGIRASPPHPTLSPSRGRGNRRKASSVHFSEHGVDGAHDGDDGGDLAADEDVRQDGEVGEGGAAPLHPVGLRAAVGEEVAAHLA